MTLFTYDSYIYKDRAPGSHAYLGDVGPVPDQHVGRAGRPGRDPHRQRVVEPVRKQLDEALGAGEVVEELLGNPADPRVAAVARRRRQARHGHFRRRHGERRQGAHLE